jgi:hypothetical protein
MVMGFIALKPNLHAENRRSDGWESFTSPTACNFGPGAALEFLPRIALSSAQAASNRNAENKMKSFFLKNLIISKDTSKTSFTLNRYKKSLAIWGHFRL